MPRRGIVLALVWLFTGLASVADVYAVDADKHLAIKGYDPVAYFTDARARLGDPRFEFAWDGAVYRFATAGHLALFKANPDRYVPIYRGLCTASLSRGEKVTADPRYWLVHDGRLHIFGKPIGPNLMRHDPDGMKAKADLNWQALRQTRAKKN
jgi:hypothetical protein